MHYLLFSLLSTLFRITACWLRFFVWLSIGWPCRGDKLFKTESSKIFGRQDDICLCELFSFLTLFCPSFGPTSLLLLLLLYDFYCNCLEFRLHWHSLDPHSSKKIFKWHTTTTTENIQIFSCTKKGTDIFLTLSIIDEPNCRTQQNGRINYDLNSTTQFICFSFAYKYICIYIYINLYTLYNKRRTSVQGSKRGRKSHHNMCLVTGNK